MKNNKIITIICFSLICLYTQVNGQIYDTLIADFGGEVTIIEKNDWDTIKSRLDRGLGSILEGNYRKFNSEGELIQEMRMSPRNENHFRKTIWKKGFKTYEEYSNYELRIFTNTYWNEKGKLIGEEIYLVDKYVSISYYENQKNSIKSLFHRQLQKLIEKDKISFTDSLTLEYWVERQDSTKHWVPIGEYIEFYENGKIKQKGHYLKNIFDVYKSHEVYEKSLNDSSITPKKKLKKRKDGNWYYYDESGEIKKVEIYKNGHLLK